MEKPRRKSKKEVDSTRWQRAGTLPKVSSFRYNSKVSPADSLHKRIRKLLPEVQSITEVGCSRRTNEYFRKELIKYARKHTFYTGKRLESAVAFNMLQCSPCDVDNAEDFVLYVRISEE